MQVTHRVSTSLRRSALALALAAAHGSVLAAGFQLIEQNASGLGNAYAGQAAAAEDASTVFFNPAGLTFTSVALMDSLKMFDGQKIDVNIEFSWGATEAKVAEGLVDAIV